MERLRIPLEFNRYKKDDMELYNTLKKYSNPAAYIKDVLRGLVPIPSQIIHTNNITNNLENDTEDLMDF